MPVINFTKIPANLRNTGVFAEVDATQANTLQTNQVTLLIGQQLSTGTATAGVARISSSLTDAQTAYGTGSMLVAMYQQYRQTDLLGEVWCLGLTDPSGTKGTGTITIGTTASAADATASGTLSLYVAGNSVPVVVTAGEINSAIATAVGAAINANVNLPVTAVVATNVVTLTARHVGIAAMDCDLQLNYLGALNSEATPAGVSVVFVNLHSGTPDPDLTTPLANLSAAPFDFICCPYTGTANLNLVQSFLNDSVGRWSYSSELFGHAFSALRGNFAAQVAFGKARNDQHASVLGFDQSPTPAYLVAADYTAACAASLRVDPAMPLGGAGDGVTMNWLAPPVAARFDFSERESLLFDGISTYLVEQGGRVRVEYAVTTYQVNGLGLPDSSYLDVETMFTLMFVIRGLRADLSTKFARKKLVSEGQRISAGSNFTTAQIVLNEAIAYYNLLAAQGMVQNAATFAQNAYAVNAGNGTVQLFLPIDLANQLRRIEMLVQFLKS